MNYRRLGKTEFLVSEVGLGAWAFGGDWGEVTGDSALATLREAVSQGVNFVDTADVYGDGLSEQRIAQLLKDFKGDRIYVASKAGRRLNPHVPSGYRYGNLREFIERSLKNLNQDCLDLVQLHCPPTEVYRRNEAFEALERLKKEGLIQHYGVSVETLEEARLALEHEGVASVQIIYNMFRLRPASEFFALAKAQDVAVIARLPLASGLLSGKMHIKREFTQDDHRSYNRHGEAFDVGETFSGVDFETGLKAAEALKDLVPKGVSLAQFALRWILMHPAISSVIPGAKTALQAKENALASEMDLIPASSMQAVKDIYDRYIREQVHDRW